MELIGECAWTLLKEGEPVDERLDLAAMAGMRHRLVHHYEGINWAVVESAAFQDVPEALPVLEAELERRGLAPLPPMGDGRTDGGFDQGIGS